VALTADQIYATFESLGLRNTRPRRLIAEKLADIASAGRDFAIDELWAELKHSEPDLGRATVFRAVDLLVEHDILDRIIFADGTHRYRVCGSGMGSGAGTHHHHHVTCVQCHRVVDVEVCLAPGALEAIARATDFALEGHTVAVFGRCPACRSSGVPTGGSLS
jgi:Fur family transcriptional regulator, ferric uptake regulator